MTSSDLFDEPARRSVRARSALLCALSLTLIAVSARAQIPEHVDLICKGTVVSWSDFDKSTAAWTGRVRLDLAHSRLCVDDCFITQKIAFPQDEVIEGLALGADTLTPDREEFADKVEVDRTTGRFYRVHDWSESGRAWDLGNVPVLHRDEYAGTCAAG